MFVVSKRNQKEITIDVTPESTKICNKHHHSVIYPSEYKTCPNCSKEKLTRSILNFD